MEKKMKKNKLLSISLVLAITLGTISSNSFCMKKKYYKVKSFFNATFAALQFESKWAKRSKQNIENGFFNFDTKTTAELKTEKLKITQKNPTKLIELWNNLEINKLTGEDPIGYPQQQFIPISLQRRQKPNNIFFVDGLKLQLNGYYAKIENNLFLDKSLEDKSIKQIFKKFWRMKKIKLTNNQQKIFYDGLNKNSLELYKNPPTIKLKTTKAPPKLESITTDIWNHLHKKSKFVPKKPNIIIVEDRS